MAARVLLVTHSSSLGMPSGRAPRHKCRGSMFLFTKGMAHNLKIKKTVLKAHIHVLTSLEFQLPGKRTLFRESALSCHFRVRESAQCATGVQLLTRMPQTSKIHGQHNPTLIEKGCTQDFQLSISDWIRAFLPFPHSAKMTRERKGTSPHVLREERTQQPKTTGSAYRLGHRKGWTWAAKEGAGRSPPTWAKGHQTLRKAFPIIPGIQSTSLLKKYVTHPMTSQLFV